MRLLHLSAIMAAATLSAAHAETYKFDPGHTEIRFYYDHAGLSEQSGEWKILDGSVEFDPDDIAATSVTVTIDAASVDTGVAALNTHLMSADFFEAESYPEITFTSTSVTQVGVDTITMEGDLTIKDVTKTVEMDFAMNHNGPHPLGKFIEYYQGQWIGVQGEGELLRSEFGVGMFAPVTSDRVHLKISAELRQGGWQ